VLFGGVGADDQHRLGKSGDVCHRVGHSARAKGSGQTGHSAGVSETGAVVYRVRPDHLAGELVHQVIFFVKTLGGGQDAHAVRSRYPAFPFSWL
jgi:hypothetical protein